MCDWTTAVAGFGQAFEYGVPLQLKKVSSKPSLPFIVRSVELIHLQSICFLLAQIKDDAVASPSDEGPIR